MYQIKILKSILDKHSLGWIDKIEGRQKQVFSNEANLEMYEIIISYFRNYHKVPSYKYLDEFFKMEKDNIAKESYEKIKEETESIPDTEALIQQQIKYYVKKQVAKRTKDLSNKVKLANLSELPELLAEEERIIASYNQLLLDKGHKQSILFGEEATQRARKRFEENSKQGYYVANFNINTIDSVLGGISKSDLVSVIGFTNQGKSPMLRFLAYQLLLQGLNVVFLSAEMTLESVEDSFYTLHANNHKRFGFNKPKITHQKLRKGALGMTKEEQDFYLNEVIPDFNDSLEMATLKIIQPEDIYSIDDLFNDVLNTHLNEFPVDALILDYATLMVPSHRNLRPDRESINLMLNRLRRWQLAFDNGNGLIVMNAVQTNRDGYTKMLKHKQNLYDLSAISDYNSIERDSTVIMSIASTDEMKAAKEVQIQNLKSRESELFPYFKMSFDGSTGWFYETQNNLGSEEEIDELLDEIEL